MTLNYYAYCVGNPVMMFDHNGNFGILTGILIGAAVGAAINMAVNLVTDYVDDGKINKGLGSYIRSGIEGAIGGAIGAATATCGLPVVLAAEGLGGFAGSALGQYVENGEVNFWEAGFEGTVNVVTAGAGHYITKGFKRLFNICFTEETEIITEEGTKKIKDIEIGDKVYSKNEHTQEKSFKEVVNLFRNKVSELVVIKINGKIIRTTTEHPFWTKNRGWVSAKDLDEEDTLEDEMGNPIQIESIQYKKLDEEITVYNFEVKEFHTYYVGEEKVLVHNMCDGAAKVKAVADMGKFFESGFGKQIKNSLDKSKTIFQGQTVYRVTQKNKNKYLKKGFGIYLDGMHKDHFEVIDKQGLVKYVLNLDGTLNLDKTKKALGRSVKGWK